MVVNCLAYSLILKMEEVRSTENTGQISILKDGTLHIIYFIPVFFTTVVYYNRLLPVC
jgi:hypothetical protein